ncbi:MAG TPA: GntR family transcriptional regulator [Candidatus Dormibacteraeota bacterium]|nr:GntR family transcriptional regulator [Candidatus Dormibacteraeota bacterium]
MGLIFREGTTFYYQVREDLTRRIAMGEFGANGQLPAELDLAQHYGVSRTTVRQAILDLVRDGILTRQRGRGTFLLPRVLVSDAHTLISFADEMKQRGIESCARLLSAREIKATAEIAAELEARENDPIFEIVRLGLGNGVPLVLRTIQVPAAIVPDLLSQPLQDEPIYDMLRERYNIVAAGSYQHFAAVAADKKVAAALKIAIGAPVLSWRGITVDINRRPIARTWAYYRGDRFEFSINQGNVADDRRLGVRMRTIRGGGRR